MARPRLYLLATLASATTTLAAASTTTVTLIPMFEPEQAKLLAGSVITADADKTGYAIGCKPGTPATSCPFGGESFTMTQGPSMWAGSFHTVVTDYDGPMVGETRDDFDRPVYHTGTIDQYVSCKLNPKRNRGICTGYMGLTISSTSGTKRLYPTMDGYSELMAPILITAGVEKLSAAPAATQTSAEATSTATEISDIANTTASPSKGRTHTGVYSLTAVASTTDSAVPASTTPASTTTSTHNAAGPMVTRNVGLAGVAAVIGGGMLLL